MKKNLVFICVAVVFGYAAISYVQAVPEGSLGQSKISDANKLFLDINVALSKERFADAHSMAERLIRDHAGDYQISLYLRLYADTFYLLDEDFQKGMLRPTPPGIQTRIEQLKAKEDKTVIDLVTLSWIGNGPGGDFSTEYMKEILDKFSTSVWAEWAEWMVIQEREYRPREKYQDKSPDERSKLLMRDLYIGGKKFIRDHPDSYLLPKILQATARWAYSSGDTTAKEESVQMCRRVLNDYPNAEYACAEARRTLRDLQGDNYQETPGCSKETDRIVTQFYCVSPEPTEHKKYTTLYVEMIEQGQAEAKPGFPILSYVLIPPSVAIVIVGLILLIRKKPGSTNK